MNVHCVAWHTSSSKQDNEALEYVEKVQWLLYNRWGHLYLYLHLIGGGIYDIWYPNPQKIATKCFSTDLISIRCQY